MTESDKIVVIAEGLTKKFDEFTAVNEVSFNVRKSEIFGFLGANGAGKTTTIRMLCGIIPPTLAKQAKVLDFDLIKDHEKVKEHIGYMSQRFSLYGDLKLIENMEFYAGVYNTKNISEIHLKKRIHEIILSLELRDSINTPTKDLPTGIKQRLSLACSIIHNPKILFLDEPTAGVDPRMRKKFWDLIRRLRESGMTIFVTTHYMDEAEACDRISIMHEGKIIAIDTPDNLKKEHFNKILYNTNCTTIEVSLKKFREEKIIDSYQPFGNNFHISVLKEKDELFRTKALDLKCNLKKIVPSLEDVFIDILS